MSTPELFPDETPEAEDLLPTKKRRGGKTAAIVLFSLLAVLVLGGVGGVWWFQKKLDGNIERIPDAFEGVTDRPTPAPNEGEADGPVNFLVLGSDSRISAGDPTQWQAGAQRTDAIMVVHLSADRKSAQVMSIPRDSWVPIPGHGEAKINAAFAYGGPSLMIQTVEQLTGVHIDHFAVTDFDSFVKLTDALGGVQIRIPADIGDGKTVFFPAGVHQMSGEEALKYTRQRYGLSDGDFGRVQRQQNWMRSILAKVNNSRNDPLVMTKFLTTVSESVATDEGLTVGTMRDLVMSARGLNTAAVTFMTAPYAGTGRSADGQSIVVLDREKFDPLVASMANDTIAAYIQDHADELKILPASVK